MTLLAPGAALLAGAIAAPLLVLLYFLKLRRRPLRVSSTLLWSQAVHDLQVNAPLRWLRASWLLALQVLALACLVVAIGRPALDMDQAAGQRVVVLIDRSAAMGAADAGGNSGDGRSRLQEAKARAKELVGSVLGAGSSKVMIVQFAAGAEALSPMTSDRTLIDEAIDRVTLADQPVDPADAFKLLATVAQKQASESADRASVTAYLISGAGFPPTARPPVLTGADLRLVRVGSPPDRPAPNLGIAALSARRDAEDPATVRIFVRIVNSAAASARAPVSFTIDGERVGSTLLDVPATTRNPAGDIVAGEAATTLGITSPAGGIVTATIDAPDALPADNSASLVLTAAARPRILLVGPGPDGSGADPFLRNALTVLDKASLRVVGPEQYDAMDAPAGPTSSGASPPPPPDFDVVLFDRVRPRRAPRTPSVSFGAPLPIDGLSLEPAPLPADAPSRRFVSWNRRHPVLRYVPLDTVIINPPRRLVMPGLQDAAAGDAPPAARSVRSTVLADGPDGPLIGLVERSGVRHIIVSFDLDRSNWGPQYPFPLFVSNAVEFLTLRAEAQAGRSFLTTEPITLHPAAGSKRVTLTPPPPPPSPAGNPAAAQAAEPIAVNIETDMATPEAPVASFGVLDRAGIYRAGGAVEPAVAVNLTDAWTSLLRTADHVEVIGQTARPEPAGRSPREIWKWFVLAAAGLLTLEWLMYAWQMRV